MYLSKPAFDSVHGELFFETTCMNATSKTFVFYCSCWFVQSLGFIRSSGRRVQFYCHQNKHQSRFQITFSWDLPQNCSSGLKCLSFITPAPLLFRFWETTPAYFLRFLSARLGQTPEAWKRRLENKWPSWRSCCTKCWLGMAAESLNKTISWIRALTLTSIPLMSIYTMRLFSLQQELGP